MAMKVKRKGKGIIESQDSQLQETQSTRPSFDHNKVFEQELSQILPPSSEPQTNEGAPQASNSIIIGSIPMAKYRYEMYLETDSKPSPIDCFKKFHTKKDGKEWATNHAKTLYKKMDAIKAKAVSEGTKTNDYQIFREVVGEPSHGCILGMGIGKGCSKRCREDFTKEKEDMEARLRQEMDFKLAQVVEKLEEKFAQKLQSMGIPQQSNIDPATTDYDIIYCFDSCV
nr:hypothetical protein CFP56_47499 [Quercus suber]